MSATEAPQTKRRRSARGTLSGTNLERAGDHNQRVTLQAIRLDGAITRSGLVEITGLTPPAIANITKRLLDDGLVRKAGRTSHGRGQPATRLAINPDGGFSIGVNIDRDHVTVVLLDFVGQVRARATREMSFALPHQVRSFFESVIHQLLARSQAPPERIFGVGVALPDDMARPDLPHRPAAYDAWIGVDVKALFADILPYPIFVENDAAAAALGELQFGHGLQNPSFFYILVTSGLGGGLVIEGNYFRGVQGRSGEIGFLPARSRGARGRSLEQVFSLSALYERLAAAGMMVERPDALVDLAPEGEQIVEAWIGESVEALVDPLVAISCLVNPGAVYVGGRLPPPLIDRLADVLNTRLRRARGLPVIAPVRRAATAADAPAIGAAILPFTDRLLPKRTALMKTGAALLAAGE